MSRHTTSVLAPLGATRAHVLLAALLAVAMLALPATAAQAASRVVDPSAETTSVQLVNQERTARGLPALVSNGELVELARQHSEAMAADVETGGTCGDGVTLRHRAQLSAGITARWTAVRENVGCGYGTHATPGVVHDGFMNSPGHRANILSSDINQVGIGAFRDVDGGLWVTQIFMMAPILVAPTPDTTRISVAVSQRTFAADGAKFAVVARSDDFADSLGGAALAGGDGPILFTPPPTAAYADPRLDSLTRAEIDRVLGGSGTVYILGGPLAVGPAVESELKSAGYTVRRLAGATRYETAVTVAEQVVRREGAPDKVLVAFGRNWPDAVTGGAAAARHGLPIVLTDTDHVPASTAAFLAGQRGSDTLVLGGPVVVSDRVVVELGARRVAGAERAETAVRVAEQIFGDHAGSAIVLNGRAVDGWASAMAWSALSARQGAPQLLVNSGDVPGATESYIRKHDPALLFADAIPSAIRSTLQAF